MEHLNCVTCNGAGYDNVGLQCRDCQGTGCDPDCFACLDDLDGTAAAALDRRFGRRGVRQP